jgi:hypothetical protein
VGEKPPDWPATTASAVGSCAGLVPSCASTSQGVTDDPAVQGPTPNPTVTVFPGAGDMLLTDNVELGPGVNGTMLGVNNETSFAPSAQAVEDQTPSARRDPATHRSNGVADRRLSPRKGLPPYRSLEATGLVQGTAENCTTQAKSQHAPAGEKFLVKVQRSAALHDALPVPDPPNPSTDGSMIKVRSRAKPVEEGAARDLFVSWIEFHERSYNLSRALGAVPHFVAMGRPGLLTAPVRHVVQGARTVRLLWRERPQVVYVMAPPLPLALLGIACCSAFGSRLVIDAHTAVVLDRRSGTRLKPWFPHVARRAYLTIVTTDPLAELLRRRGVNAVALDDAPTEPVLAEGRADHPRPLAVMPASWDGDEPISTVFETARRLPQVDVAVTGRPRFGRRGRRVPPNVRLEGKLGRDEYAALLRRADLVLALTTAELTMQCAGYEGLAYEKPLVLSDTGALRAYFTAGSVFVDPLDPDSIARGITRAIEEGESLSNEAGYLRRQRAAEWEAQLRAVKRLLEKGESEVRDAR